MEVITNIKILREKIERIGSSSIGLIYTKGELHKGHQSLIQAARKENNLVIVANLLVPREFESKEAYNLYPKYTEENRRLASLAGADFFFTPDIEVFESEEMMVTIKINDGLKSELNGEGRPRYYEEQLVTLMKLLNITKAKQIYMSDKDLQQIYFTKMFLKQFHYDCKLKVLPAIRDKDGLVLSQRNRLLKLDEKKQICEIQKIFVKAQTAYERGMTSARKIKWHVENEMTKLYLCRLEFVEILEPERLRKIETITDEAILMIGIRVGLVRICDYTYLKVAEKVQEI